MSITNSMDQSPSREANSRSSCQEIVSFYNTQQEYSTGPYPEADESIPQSNGLDRLDNKGGPTDRLSVLFPPFYLMMEADPASETLHF
jgi:hypothetical protein